MMDDEREKYKANLSRLRTKYKYLVEDEYNDISELNKEYSIHQIETERLEYDYLLISNYVLITGEEGLRFVDKHLHNCIPTPHNMNVICQNWFNNIMRYINNINAFGVCLEKSNNYIPPELLIDIFKYNGITPTQLIAVLSFLMYNTYKKNILAY